MQLHHVTKPIKEKKIVRSWHLIDANGQILGRLAGKVSRLLQGKHKIDFVPYLDCGDFVVVINAGLINLTGKKLMTKVYQRYSGYPGGRKLIPFKDLIKKNPAEIIKRAVAGMLPKNKLRDQRLKRLYIYADSNHPFQDKFFLKKKTS